MAGSVLRLASIDGVVVAGDLAVDVHVAEVGVLADDVAGGDGMRPRVLAPTSALSKRARIVSRWGGAGDAGGGARAEALVDEVADGGEAALVDDQIVVGQVERCAGGDREAGEMGCCPPGRMRTSPWLIVIAPANLMLVAERIRVPRPFLFKPAEPEMDLSIVSVVLLSVLTSVALTSASGRRGRGSPGRR